MARPRSKAPARRYHISGQDVVTIDGRDYYLGPHDSAMAIARYAVLMAKYQESGLRLPADFNLSSLEDRAAIIAGAAAPLMPVSDQTKQPATVRHVTAAYRAQVKVIHADNKQELHRVKMLCDELDKHDGNVLVKDYGPVKLKAQRKRWIDAGKARVYCNRLTNLVVRMWKFAVSEEIVTENLWTALKSVEPLKVGQTTAREVAKREAVKIDDVRLTAKQLTPVLKAMVRVQLATGMRPSELCNMRPCEIDRSGSEWIYRPAKHKTAHKGITKAIPIVGDAREAIEDYINRPANKYLFSPRESMLWHIINKLANKDTVIGLESVQWLGEKYSPTSYRQSIQRAAKRAKVSLWYPYQIRHLALSEVRKALNVEAAQALAGHARVDMTEHYAGISEERAIEAAKMAPRL